MSHPIPDGSGAISPAALERLNYLDEWISRRIEEADAAEARLEKRLSHVSRAEQAIRDLSESLRQQVAEACPVLQQLAEFQKAAAGTVEQVMGDARGQFAQAVELVRSRMAMLGEAEESFKGRAEAFEQAFAKLVADGESESRRVLEILPAELGRRVERFEKDLARAVELAGESAAGRVTEMQARAAAIEESVREAVSAGVARVGQEVESALRRGVDGARLRAEELAGPVVHELEKQIERGEMRIEGLVESTREKLTARAEGFEKALAQQGADFQRQLGKLSADAERQSGAHFAEMKQAIRRQAESAAEELRRVAQEVSEEMSRQLQAAAAQLAGQLGQAKQMLSQSAGQVASAADSMIEAAEQRLMGRLKDLRPRVVAMADDADKALGVRLQRLLDNARAMVELHESQLAGKIETLRPRASAAMRIAETEMTAQLVRLEQEAIGMLAGLEQRLARRVHDVTGKARQAMRGELAGLDSIDTRQLQQELQSALQARPAEGVSVDLFLDETRTAKVA